MANPKSRRGRKILVLSIIVLAIAGLTAAALLRKREPVIKVQKEKVTRRNLTEKVTANGRIQPFLQVKISAEVSGEIIELPVKEGQRIAKGDLLVRIKPDMYVAARRSSEANYKSSAAGRDLAVANLHKAELEFNRNQQLFESKLISETLFVEYTTGLEIARAQLESSTHQVEVAKAALARADEELAKTTIYSPLNGTVSKLNSELGERVVGTAMMTGTEIMIVADLNDMEARVDIGEIDIPLIALGQTATLEVDAFRDRKFKGLVSEIANSSKGAAATGQSQEGTKFEVRVRIKDKETFRPGMSITAVIETRYRTNALTVPIQSVTTRPPKKPETKPGQTNTTDTASATNTASTSTNATDTASPASTNATTSTDAESTGRKADDKPRHVEVVFLVEGDHVKMVPVKRGISDDNYTEITEGLSEGQEVVSGGYKAISKELEDGKKILVGDPDKDAKDKDKEKETK